ncbi:MAG: methyltransferase type 11 [Frankiales bacterium]|nr:methyltransferase type 11 [Frankiales bacterium]
MTALPALPPNARLRWSVVGRVVEDLNPGSVLEIGCGLGSFGARLAARSDYLGVEPDPTSFAVAKSRIEPAGGVVLNETSDALEPERQFDLVCAFEVLEHLEDDTAAVESWTRFIRPGGHLVLSMPAWPDRYNAWDTLVGHYRRYSPSEVHRLLEGQGLREVHVVVYGWPLGYALEAVRSKVAVRKQDPAETEDVPMAKRTAGSGRILQPKAAAGKLVETMVVPFTQLQRLRPSAGTGLVAVARRP